MADDPNNRRYDGPMRFITTFGPQGNSLWISKVGFWLDDKSLTLGCKILVHIVMDVAPDKVLYSIGRNKLVENEQGDIQLDDDAYKQAYMDAIQHICKYLSIDVPGNCPIVYDEGGERNG